MSDLNVYASKIYSEHPLAIWALDENVGPTGETEFPQYTTSINPATVSKKCSQGVPMVYGSRQSIRLANLGDDEIIISEPRTWAKVKNDPDTLAEEKWEYWKDKTSPSVAGNWIVKDWLTEDITIVDGMFSPSITHYGYGMFTNKGKYNTYTAEFWMRIDARTTESTKIWGTLNTFDGLWVNDNYITLVVGKENKSYAVENWYRPMLIDVTYTPTQARLIINGQEVISLSYITDDIDFSPVMEGTESETGTLGFALGNNIKLYEVDCLALYSYVVPDDVLKRRFVWGQGVREDTNLSTAYDTQVTYIDYPYSEYSNNVLYPDLYTWESGYLNNLISGRQSLKTPDFQLPEIFVNGRNRDTLYRENQARQAEREKHFFTFQPEFDWDQPSYFYFNDINKLSEPLQAVYGVFEVDEGMIDPENLVEEPLMVFRKENGETVSIVVYGKEMRFKYSNRTRMLHPDLAPPQEVDGPFSAGFELNKLLHSSGANEKLKRFFSNISDIKLYVGGDGVNTFSGFIYSVGIGDTSSAARNSLDTYFDENGFASSSLLGVITSYTIVPRVEYGEFWLDVAADCYWEDSIALSVLGKNLSEPTLNFFQFNIGHDGSYQIVGDSYDFTSSELNSYIAFQPVSETIQKSSKDFENTGTLPKNRVVKPGADWATTKYPVINGTVIYPPEDVDFTTLRATIFLEVKAENTIHSPFQVKNLSLAPQAYETNSDVGTLFGSRITTTDPFAIYKESTPYLYLTKDSGVEPLEGKVEIAFNESLTSPYPVNMLTAWIKPDFKNMGETLMEIDVGGASNVSIVFDSDEGNSKIFKVSSPENTEIATESKFYKNDNDIVSPGLGIKLEDNQWAFIGVEFPYPVNSGGTEGKIILHQGAVYQNVTLSKATVRGLASVAIIRDYFDLKQQVYGYWTNLAKTAGWTYRELLTTESSFSYQTSPLDAFNIYSGNNGIIIGEDSELKIEETQGTILLNVDWKTYDRKPA